MTATDIAMMEKLGNDIGLGVEKDKKPKTGALWNASGKEIAAEQDLMIK